MIQVGGWWSDNQLLRLRCGRRIPHSQGGMHIRCTGGEGANGKGQTQAARSARGVPACPELCAAPLHVTGTAGQSASSLTAMHSMAATVSAGYCENPWLHVKTAWLPWKSKSVLVAWPSASDKFSHSVPASGNDHSRTTQRSVRGGSVTRQVVDVGH